MKLIKTFLKIVSIFLFGILVSFSCKEKDPLLPPEGYQSVTLQDLTGLDACGLVLKLNNSNEMLEPLNLNDFSINLITGNEYWIKYEINLRYGSFCMVGDVVTLLDLKAPFNY
jgi:hypothetical protein